MSRRKTTDVARLLTVWIPAEVLRPALPLVGLDGVLWRERIHDLSLWPLPVLPAAGGPWIRGNEVTLDLRLLRHAYAVLDGPSERPELLSRLRDLREALIEALAKGGVVRRHHC